MYFEYIYFARPDSFIDGISVYDSRILAGKFLAMDSPVDADLVIGVPESGNCAAMGYSMQSGIPYGMGFVKMPMWAELLSSRSRRAERAVYRSS